MSRFVTHSKRIFGFNFLVMGLTTAIAILSICTLPFVSACYVWWHNSDNALYISHHLSKHSAMKPMFEIILAWFFGLFIPILAYLKVVYFISFADFMIGVTAAIIAGQTFSWRKASLLVAKFVCWTFLLASTYQIQLLLKIPSIKVGELELSVTLAVAGVVAYAELKSIFKNIKEVFGIDIGGFIGSKFEFLKNFNTKNEGTDT
jgi:hypothetical protein